MKTPLFAKHAVMVTVLAAIATAGVVYAASSYRIGAGGQTAMVNEHGECRNVTNHNGADIFVPTNTSGEWSSFRNNAQGVSLNPCAVYGCTDPSATNYNPSATHNDGSCQYPPPPTCQLYVPIIIQDSNPWSTTYCVFGQNLPSPQVWNVGQYISFPLSTCGGGGPCNGDLQYYCSSANNPTAIAEYCSGGLVE